MSSDLTAGYTVTDEFFGVPYADIDENRSEPTTHRFVHGGFADTDTRFAFYFPPADRYEGRFLHSLEGAGSGSEYVASQMTMFGGESHWLDCGAYLVESNQGHIGTGELGSTTVHAPALYAYRASAETARLSQHVAAKVYGTRPHHGYLYADGIGASRAIWCLENVSDVWDGAVPFGLGNINSFTPFSAVNNVRELLAAKLLDVVDAMEPGGNGDPFETLTVEQREELVHLYRLGFPRGGERNIVGNNTTLFFWTLDADRVIASDADYFRNFWSEPGYVGFDRPEALISRRLNLKTAVKRVVTAAELAQVAAQAGTDGHAALFLASRREPEAPIAIVVDSELPTDPRGSTLSIESAYGQSNHYCLAELSGILVAGALGQDTTAFEHVVAGDELVVDNADYLAYCYYYRHHVDLRRPEFQAFEVDGQPVYPQHSQPATPSFFAPPTDSSLGDPYSGEFSGKMIFLQQALDGVAWPSEAIRYESAVRSVREEQTNDCFRLWWMDRADHLPPQFAAPGDAPVESTRTIDFRPCVTQALRDLIDWTENDLHPAQSTNYTYSEDCRLTLAANATDRGGIQPVVVASANNSERAETRVGEPVTLHVEAEVPPGQGTIVAVEWDFDGLGTWPFHHDEVDGTAKRVDLTVRHTFEDTGTYFPAVRVSAHRDGPTGSSARRIANIARVRVVVG